MYLKTQEFILAYFKKGIPSSAAHRPFLTMKRANVVLFLSSPSDVRAEQQIVLEEVKKLNGQMRSQQRPRITVVSWPEGIAAGASDYPQSVINQQTREYDIFVVIIGTRLGTQTPRANSGTEEEFDRAIESAFRGNPVQVLVFFSNLKVPIGDLDPHQLMLVQYFRAKTQRLGVLFHKYSNLPQFRRLFRKSLAGAFSNIIQTRSAIRIDRRKINDEAAPVETNSLGSVLFRKQTTAPQWAANPYIVSLAPYRDAKITLRGLFHARSPYFRFGFKYCDSREPLFSPGSVQTFGQNILVHIGKNTSPTTWFLTAYRAGVRLDPDMPLPNLDTSCPVNFSIEIVPFGNLALRLNESVVFERFFLMDGIPCLALLAWGDEHDFECELTDIHLEVIRFSNRLLS